MSDTLIAKDATLEIKTGENQFKKIGMLRSSIKKKPDINENLLIGTKEIREKLLERFKNAPPLHSRCMMVGDWFNIKEDKKMYKNQLDLLSGEEDWATFKVNMKEFSDRGFIIEVIYEGTYKREFVEYGENVGIHIRELINDFIDDLEDEQRKQDEIEFLEGDIENNKERLAELKNK